MTEKRKEKENSVIVSPQHWNQAVVILSSATSAVPLYQCSLSTTVWLVPFFKKRWWWTHKEADLVLQQLVVLREQICSKRHGKRKGGGKIRCLAVVLLRRYLVISVQHWPGNDYVYNVDWSDDCSVNWYSVCVWTCSKSMWKMMMMTAWTMTVGTRCWGLSLSSTSLTDRCCINYGICLVIMWCLLNIILVAVAHWLILDT